MKRFYLAAAATLLSFGIANAQSNFKPGYILTTGKDTVKGFVDYREWERNPKQITFKPGFEQTAQKITVANSAGFGVTGSEFYDKAVVKVSTGKVELSSLPDAIDTAYTTDTVFLKKIVRGSKICLYSYTDDNKAQFYVLDNQTKQITPLSQFLYLDRETRNLAAVNSYINRLLVFAGTYQPNDKALQNGIIHARYNEDNLAKVVLKINGDAPGRQTVVKNSLTRAFIGAGVRRGTVKFNGDAVSSPFVSGTSGSSVAPFLAGGLDLIANRYTEKWVIRMEGVISYGPYKIEEPANNQPVRHKLDFKLASFSFIPQVMYNFYSTDRLKAFIDAGIALNVYSYQSKGYQYIYADGTTRVAPDYPELEKFQLSFPVKAGVQLNNKFQVYAGYTVASSIARYFYWGANLSTMQLGVNYLFK